MHYSLETLPNALMLNLPFAPVYCLCKPQNGVVVSDSQATILETEVRAMKRVRHTNIA
jgi:hypothetical protein